MLYAAQSREFDLETDALGVIHCGNFTLKMLGEIETCLQAGDMNNSALVRKILKQVGQRAGEEKPEGTEKNENTPLTDADINRLSSQEIEEFARNFLVKNDWLIGNRNDSEHSVTQNDGERDSDYLARAFKHTMNEHTERMRRIAKEFPPLQRPFPNASSLLRPFLTPPPNPTHETNQHLDELLDRADQWYEEFNESNRRSECRSWIAIGVASVGCVAALVAAIASVIALL